MFYTNSKDKHQLGVFLSSWQCNADDDTANLAFSLILVLYLFHFLVLTTRKELPQTRSTGIFSKMQTKQTSTTLMLSYFNGTNAYEKMIATYLS